MRTKAQYQRDIERNNSKMDHLEWQIELLTTEADELEAQRPVLSQELKALRAEQKILDLDIYRSSRLSDVNVRIVTVEYEIHQLKKNIAKIDAEISEKKSTIRSLASENRHFDHLIQHSHFPKGKKSKIATHLAAGYMLFTAAKIATAIIHPESGPTNSMK